MKIQGFMKYAATEIEEELLLDPGHSAMAVPSMNPSNNPNT